MTKLALVTLAILSAATCDVLAKTCTEKFAELMIGKENSIPSKSVITTKPKNGPEQKNEFFYMGIGHWMTVMEDPKQPRSLAYKNVMYISSDGGKTWKNIRTMDSKKNNEIARKDRVKNAETIKNAVCGEEELDGKMFDTIEADFKTLGNYKSENHYKYWVNREDGWVAKSVYDSKSSNYESLTIQLIEPVPELQLPKPE